MDRDNIYRSSKRISIKVLPAQPHSCITFRGIADLTSQPFRLSCFLTLLVVEASRARHRTSVPSVVASSTNLVLAM